MRLRQTFWILLLSLCGLLSSPRLNLAADEATHSQDEQTIRAAAQDYANALKRNDARAMHDLWVADGDIVDEFGHAESAHKVIDRGVQARLADATDDIASQTVNVVDTSIRFLTPDVALEDGRVEVANGSEASPTLRGRFTAVWVKREGNWRLASLREAPVPTSTAAELAGLDWMVGDWTGQVGKSTFDVTARWNANHTLLERDLTVTHDGKTVYSGEQRVGVDPLDGRIRSWLHGADGGRGEGVWTKHGDKTWLVQAAGVTPNGRRTQATNLYTFDGKNQISWKSTGGFSDGKPVPDLEITLDRNDTSAQREPERPDGRNP